MVKINRRGLPFPPILCLLVALRFYATGNFQIATGDIRGFSQRTVSRCIFKISRLLAQLLPTYIKFPEGLENQRKNQRLFYDIANFPKVTGCIDCTHIPIKSPLGDSGYPCLPYLMTPLLNPGIEQEVRYKTDLILEREIPLRDGLDCGKKDIVV
uniref:Nuclease HARBI1 n=1 Tax=Diabrotica virgifera virgifera TaxID=50390 RepID=A0A6P7GFM2_DIAVI